MDQDFTCTAQRVVFSPLFTLRLLFLEPTEFWTLVGRRGTWGPICLPLFYGSSLSPSASVKVQPRCEGGSPARRPPQPLPDNLNLRIKQRSLTNLTLVSDGEQRVYSFDLTDPPSRLSQPLSSSPYLSFSQRAGGSLQSSPRKEGSSRNAGVRGTRARSLSLSLTKVLSQSEHSLIPVPWRCTAAGGRSQRASYSGHPRTEPQRRSREGSGEDGESSNGCSNTETAGERGGGRQGGREKDGGYWAEEEASEGGPREGTAQLDKEVILSMLGDLEQVLHTSPQPYPRKLTIHLRDGGMVEFIQC
ncbi:hypothetical protein XENOCAPTIV_014571, partial [Xenoophorus captivus]